jgi:hypothetical protein
MVSRELLREYGCNASGHGEMMTKNVVCFMRPTPYNVSLDGGRTPKVLLVRMCNTVCMYGARRKSVCTQCWNHAGILSLLHHMVWPHFM